MKHRRQSTLAPLCRWSSGMFMTVPHLPVASSWRSSMTEITKPCSIAIGQGNIPPRVVQHIAQVAVGQGNTPPRVVLHIAQVAIGQGNTPPRVVQHVAAVSIGQGNIPPAVVRHTND